MANSILEFHGTHLWVGDDQLEVILFDFTKLLKKELSETTLIDKHNLEWFKVYHEDLMYYLMGFSTGGIDFELESIHENENKLNVFTNLLTQTKELIAQKESEISISDLNIIEDIKPGEKSYWKNPIKTQKITEIIDKILSMLNMNDFDKNKS